MWNFFDFRSDPDLYPDPLFPEVDPRIRIRIHINMKWIRNTDFKKKRPESLPSLIDYVLYAEKI